VKVDTELGRNMDETLKKHVLDFFMAPRSVAIVGASRKTGEESFNVIENMKKFGYKGRIYPVNPSAKKIMGMKSYKDIREIGKPVDIAIISTPREHIPRIVEDSAHLGIKGVIVIPQGFADADVEGKILQERLVQIARDRGIRILGPNTLGVINAFSGFTSSFILLRKEKVPVGVICQSGIFFVGSSLFTGMMGKGIDLGNSCDIDFADAIEYFGEDKQIEVIFAHIEGMRAGRRFFEVAKRVAHRKPIIALKTAQSQQGATAAQSHSGSLVGDHEVFEAAFKQAGVISAHDPEEVLDYTKAFLNLPLMKGNRVGVITFSGAAGIILIDAFQKYGLVLAELSPRTIRSIKALSPRWMSIQNPLDIWPALMKHGLANVYSIALSEVLKDPGVDGVICTAVAPGLPEQAYLDVTKVIKEKANSFPKKPIVVWLYGGKFHPVIEKLEEGRKVASYPTLPRAARVLSTLHRRYQFLKQTLSYPPRFPIKGGKRNIQKKVIGIRNNKIDEKTAYALLEGYGIPVVKSRYCQEFSEVMKAAEEIGYPVVLKISSPQITHKTEVGGIVLDLKGPMDLKKAYDSLLASMKKKVRQIKLDGFIVQEMVLRGKEIILGAKRDQQFGPILIFGAGGIYAEVWKDISYGIAPLSSQDAKRMIQETRYSQILGGIRGEKGCDINLLMDCLLRLSRLMLDMEEIQEIDINPFVIFSEGGLAVDARIIVLNT
jgi:acyl-CoA synthetase (NDP forming)